MNKRAWLIINFGWLVVFLIGAFFILHRKVDGAGVIQTSDAKLISLIVWGSLFVLIGIVELVIGFVFKRKER